MHVCDKFLRERAWLLHAALFNMKGFQTLAGAVAEDRTQDLILTKDALYH